MPVLQTVLLVLAGLLVAATVLPLARVPFWWVRSFDFPRLQLLALLVAVGIGLAVVGASQDAWGLPTLVALGFVAASALYQVWRIWPYTPLARVQSVPAAAAAEGRRLRLVISNVLMTNRDGARWLAVVREADPDVVVAVETDAWWAETTAALTEALPHSVQLPQDDTYGMCVYSRFPIETLDVEHLVEPEVPSLFVTLRLPAGDAVRCVFLHPRPPRPDVGQDSTLRDAELVTAARAIADWDGPVVVAGDLNDVAWSHTTHLFQKLSGLLDPRVGRGLFSTFHAAHAWLRYPLDHVFHSDALALVDLARLPRVGSDHFPMCITLAVAPAQQDEQDAPDADADDADDADDILDDAATFKARETADERAERIADDV